ncbi:helix-turn-helix domain-containing protein [Streptomyces sp. NL15-2K]|uniref:helix-turn-helix domain-containing protein n=1 Tax=Streptomyces sp. NL15-2K TaxID=376149 RepID=UPI000F581F06|nr:MULTISPECIES: helix-turn-helix transcriptional regulator [Actinomycetes]WKX09124.1 helix-turn-helix transcriptional regulator [Kutzneria buriramensis]GCB49371.1 XRE family transcriptional regulator [Streptomyces sp. NL15-2K]
MTFGETLRGYRQRRRLSQLDLALRANTTQRHLSFVESGRSTPGRDLVVRLATSLDLPLREQNGLLLAAGFAPLVSDSGPDGPELSAVRQALQEVLDGHRPYPAFVMNRHGDVLAVNDAMGVMTEGAAPELCQGRWNAYRMGLHPQGMAPRVRNLAHWSRHILGNLRAELTRNPDDRLAALVTELEGYAPPAADVPHLGFAVPLELASRQGDLRLLAMIATFTTAHDAAVTDLKLETFLPADPNTATRLRAAQPDRTLIQ